MIANACKQQIPPLRFAPVGMTTKSGWLMGEQQIPPPFDFAQVRNDKQKSGQ
jgi:hypothetical protein